MTDPKGKYPNADKKWRKAFLHYANDYYCTEAQAQENPELIKHFYLEFVEIAALEAAQVRVVELQAQLAKKAEQNSFDSVSSRREREIYAKEVRNMSDAELERTLLKKREIHTVEMDALGGGRFERICDSLGEAQAQSAQVYPACAPVRSYIELSAYNEATFQANSTEVRIKALVELDKLRTIKFTELKQQAEALAELLKAVRGVIPVEPKDPSEHIDAVIKAYEAYKAGL